VESRVEQELFEYQTNVNVAPVSIAFPVIVILSFSLPEEETVVVRGAVLVQVNMVEPVVSFPALSLTLARIVIDVGSSWIQNPVVAEAVQADRVIPSELKA
jgi:hypothetical protein